MLQTGNSTELVKNRRSRSWFGWMGGRMDR